MVIYIHGFGSSGLANKAEIFRKYFNSIGEDFISPSLSYNPTLALSTLEELISSYHGEVYLIGSSLGGFYATNLATMAEVKKVLLINPSVKPEITLQRYIPKATLYYDGSSFEFKKSHIKLLKRYRLTKSKLPRDFESKFMVLLQKGDEVLDYHEALEFFDGAKVLVEDGGNHGFVGIKGHLEEIREFFAIGDFFKHTSTIKGVGLDNKTLAYRAGDLYYDDLGKFLSDLADKIEEDALADESRGRLKLSSHLKDAQKALREASSSIDLAWDISKKPTIEWLKKNGSNRDVE